MRRLIEDYEQYINELQQNAVGGDSYLSKFSVKNDVYEQIRLEQEETKLMMAKVLQEASVLRKIQQYRQNPIPDHFLFKTTPLRQILTIESRKCQKWLQYIKINHQIKIKVKILKITPVLRRIGNTENEIVFDSLSFHLHHIDQSKTSKQMRYLPDKNIFSYKDVLNGRLIRQNRSVDLQVVHVIRSKNYKLYEQLCQQTPITVIAQSSYGMILGRADMQIDEIVEQNMPINQIQRSIIFKQHNMKGEGKEFTCCNTLIGKIQISIESYPIAPTIEQLQQNANMETKKNKNSRSPSPNRVISKSPHNRAFSPNSKVSLLSGLIKPNVEIIKLTIFQNWEYKYLLVKFNPTNLKQKITYIQISNIKQKKIELIKWQQNYYLKCWISRQKEIGEQGLSMINFKFNNQQFYLYVIKNTLFQTVKYQDYAKTTNDQKKKEKNVSNNKLVRLPGQILIYGKDNTRIIKNYIKQTVIDGILSNIFVKTPYGQCQIYTHRPFIIAQIVHKEDGYMIYYYHEDLTPVEKETNKTIVLFLKTNHKNIIQMHMFDCAVTSRLAEIDIVFKHLKINNSQSLYRISMNMITNESYFYEIRSMDYRVNVVNGKKYKYSKDNQDLLIQILENIQQRAKIDLIFYDEKYRSFFVQVELYQQNSQAK